MAVFVLLMRNAQVVFALQNLVFVDVPKTATVLMAEPVTLNIRAAAELRDCSMAKIVLPTRNA
jgi:hypothetical protein